MVQNEQAKRSLNIYPLKTKLKNLGCHKKQIPKTFAELLI